MGLRREALALELQRRAVGVAAVEELLEQTRTGLHQGRLHDVLRLQQRSALRNLNLNGLTKCEGASRLADQFYSSFLHAAVSHHFRICQLPCLTLFLVILEYLGAT